MWGFFVQSEVNFDIIKSIHFLAKNNKNVIYL